MQILCSRILAAVSLASFGNEIIYPWIYGPNKHPKAEEMSRLAYLMSGFIKRGHIQEFSDYYNTAYYTPGTIKQLYDGSRFYLDKYSYA